MQLVNWLPFSVPMRVISNARIRTVILFESSTTMNPIRVQVLVKANEFLRPICSVKKVRVIMPVMVEIKMMD